jgi:uncharacterized OB-fold protein
MEGATKVLKGPEAMGLSKGGSTVVMKPGDGRPLYVKCSQCAQVSKNTSRFCNKCGSKLENAPAADASQIPPPAFLVPPAAAPNPEASRPPVEPSPAPSPAAPAQAQPPVHSPTVVRWSSPHAGPGIAQDRAAPAPASGPATSRRPVQPEASSPALPVQHGRKAFTTLTAKIDRTHRKAAQVCEECGVLNVGYEQCIDCGADLKKIGGEKTAWKPA